MPEGSREKKSEFEGLGIKSLLLLPLHLKGVLAGFLGFDSIICVEEWNDDDIAILRVASEVIGRAIEHECQQEELRRHRHHLKDMLEERTKELKDLNGKLVTETDERKRLETQMRQMQEKESSELDPHIPSPLMHIRSESYPQN
jgi:GAF domain-containing protein